MIEKCCVVRMKFTKVYSFLELPKPSKLKFGLRNLKSTFLIFLDICALIFLNSDQKFFVWLVILHADCSKHDPDMSEDTEKNFAELLTEELKLREAEALENQQRADMALLEAKKITSQYLKEADKCNSGMETCEEAREKAEAALAAQKKLTAMWLQRARQKGWKEGVAKSRAGSQGNVQAV